MESETFNIDELLLRVLERRADESDIIYFSRWMEDEEHRVYFGKIKKVWNLSAGVHSDRESLEKGLDDYRRFMHRTSRSKKVKRMMRAIAAAAAVVAMIIVSSVWITRQDNIVGAVKDIPVKQHEIILTMADGKRVNVLSDSLSLFGYAGGQVKINKNNRREIVCEVKDTFPSDNPLDFNELIVPVGERVALWLPDGTRVWLNSESSLRYPVYFGKGNREVEIRGNAYFEVVKDSLHPFIVKTREITTEVLGTSFEVNVYGDGNVVSTTLVKGSVRVKAGTRSAIIKPNQQFVYNTKSGSVEVLKVDAANKVRWTRGILVIDNERFDDVIWKLERWYGVTIVNETGIQFNQFFSGEFDREDIQTAIRTICTNLNISFSIDKDRVILKK